MNYYPDGVALAPQSTGWRVDKKAMELYVGTSIVQGMQYY